jgi:aspartate/methionine/tyrosine aminotransferase
VVSPSPTPDDGNRHPDRVPVPRGLSGAEALAARLIEGGVIVTPGSFFGPAGEGFIRMALVPPLADCERAAGMLERLLD